MQKPYLTGKIERCSVSKSQALIPMTIKDLIAFALMLLSCIGLFIGLWIVGF